jgi:acyl-CoA dehydrogenase
MASEPRDDVELRAVAPTAVASLTGLHSHNPTVVLGALARAEQAAGAVHRTLEHCLAYVGERTQFGRLLSGFQVIQHHLAVAAGEVAAASMAVDAASVRCIEGGCTGILGGPFDIAVAKIRTGQAASRLAAVAHQVHGAMGFTYEHTLHLATRRLWSWRSEFGSGSQWAAWLGSEVIQRGKEHLWPAITNQSVDK